MRLKGNADRARSNAKALRDGQRLADQRTVAQGTADRVDRDVLKRWGVSEEQLLNGRVQAKAIKADIREVAKREADDVAGWLLDNDLADLSRPDRLKQTTDIFGRKSSRRQASGFDFLEGLDEAELARVRGRFVDNNLYSPDLLAEQVRRKTGLDLTDDEAMNWLVERWLHEDALRSVASGRIPKYANVENLLPADYGLEGYDLSKLFGVDLDEAAGHVARLQADEAATYAARALGRPSVGRPPWEMDLGDYVRELESLEDVLRNVTEGSDPGPVFRTAQARIRELAPPDIDPTGAMNPTELFERIRVTAQTAGYETP